MMNHPQGRSVGRLALHGPPGPDATRAYPAPPSGGRRASRFLDAGTELFNSASKVVIARKRDTVAPIHGGKIVKRFLFVIPSLLIAFHTAPVMAGGTIGSPDWPGNADIVQVAQVISANDIIEIFTATEERPAEGNPTEERLKNDPRSIRVEAQPAPPPPTVRFDNVEFAFGSADLTDAARRQLDELGKALASDELSPYDFRISGHTDATGTEQFNQVLSERRANAVRDYLIRNYAISGERLDAIGLGETAPAIPGDPFDPSNRRVEITKTSAGG